MSEIYLDACIIIYFVEKHPVYASEIAVAISEKSVYFRCI